LQEQNLQTVEGIVNTLYPNYNSEVLVIFGCEVTDNGDGTQTTKAGKIYKDGEIYDVAASTVAIADTPIWQLSTTSEQGKFGDGNTYTLRQNKTLVLADGASGSGFADVADGIKLSGKIYEWETLKAAKNQGAWTALTLANGWAGTLEYRKTEWGQVEIRGHVDGSARTSDVIATDVPLSILFLDSEVRIFPISVRDSTAATWKVAHLQLGTNLNKTLTILEDAGAADYNKGDVTIHVIYTLW
jgi:hypothetical protein